MWTQFHDRQENTWNLGDWMAVRMRPDNAWFRGVLQEIHPDYIIINGAGFPIDDIQEAAHDIPD